MRKRYYIILTILTRIVAAFVCSAACQIIANQIGVHVPGGIKGLFIGALLIISFIGAMVSLFFVIVGLEIFFIE